MYFWTRIHLIYRWGGHGVQSIKYTVTPTLGMTQKNQPKIRYTLDFDVTPHQLRHTYITNLLYAGVDPKTVQYVTVNEVNSNQKFWLDSKKYIEYIANKKCIWYNASRQNDKVKFIYNTAKAPELRPLRLFYSVWAGWLIPPGWLPAAIFYPTICKCSRRLHLPR